MEVFIERVAPERLLSWRWHPAAIDPAVDYSQEPTTPCPLHSSPREPTSPGRQLRNTWMYFRPRVWCATRKLDANGCGRSDPRNWTRQGALWKVSPNNGTTHSLN